ncbi:sce7726 family protein [Stutzerimonas stutzeri]|uniref:sce7726 family protein n=1 Tax=Stutzerimonas stutzeri TaxID=316 RepID=UPI00210A6E13|nr:sce7726 family protein [Stutzerimonas stutzeri]MCQ4243381.1 sce7726 family protein [Stutzerimonas stutzeri]
MSTEIEIKALVLNKLLKLGAINKTSLVFNEMNLAGKERRVDLGYLTNNQIVAIEIKSEKDTLYRLSGQISGYRRYFDKIILVVAKKFTETAVGITENEVEIWEVDDGHIKVIRRGKIIKNIDKRSYIELMTRREIRILAKYQNIQHSDLAIYELKQEVLSRINRVSKEKIKLALIDGLYNRFQLASNRFLSTALAKDEITPHDVPLLSPHSLYMAAQ